jgi:hypothetical protein
MTWRLHIEKIEAKAFRTIIRLYFLFKSERLSANIKLTLHKALIRSVITLFPPGNLRQKPMYWNWSTCKIRFRRTEKHTWKTPQWARCLGPTFQQCSSRGTFYTSQRNHRQEQVGEDFSGNQPDQLSGFMGLHWTARLTKRASVKSKHTPSSLQAATPSAEFNCKSPGHRNRPPTSNIKELRLKFRITQVVFTDRVNKSAYHLQPSINCWYTP